MTLTKLRDQVRRMAPGMLTAAMLALVVSFATIGLVGVPA